MTQSEDVLETGDTNYAENDEEIAQNDFAELPRRCENLIKETETELQCFRQRYNDYQMEMQNLNQQNERCRLKMEQLALASNCSFSRDDATTRQLRPDESFHNLLKQIEILKSENQSLRNMHITSQKTIKALEQEVSMYQQDLSKLQNTNQATKFEEATTRLINTIKSQKEELQRQSMVIQKLNEQRNFNANKIVELEKTIAEQNLMLEAKQKECSLVEELQKKIKDYAIQTQYLERSANDMMAAVTERLEREQKAIKKVEEALAIAETAVAEKDDAQTRERIVKEECDNLATTIGEVMEEAARKVDRDIENLNRNFVKKEQRYVENIERLREEMENQKHLIEILESRCKRLEHKYQEINSENARLKLELRVATNNLTELEQKLETSVVQWQNEQTALKQVEELGAQVQNYIAINKAQKIKYKALIEELSNNCEAKLKKLRDQNMELRSELRYPRLQRGSED